MAKEEEKTRLEQTRNELKLNLAWGRRWGHKEAEEEAAMMLAKPEPPSSIEKELKAGTKVQKLASVSGSPDSTPRDIK